MISIESLKHSKNPFLFFKWLKAKILFNKNHPFYFRPNGLVVFTGPQGSGKTINAVLYVEDLLKKYPKCIIKTNLLLNDFPIDNERVFLFKNMDDFFNNTNGEYGIIYLIDEIQLYFNSLQSKNINMDVMQVISQQRKQRIHIVGTSQVFGRMAKPLREQFSDVIVCKNYFGFIQYDKLINRDSIEDNDNGTTLKGKVKKKFLWFHNPKYYEKYDTYYVIQQNNFIAEEEKKIGIYDTEYSVSLKNFGGVKNG